MAMRYPAPGRYDIHTLHTSAVAEYHGDAELQYLPWRLCLVARFHGSEERNPDERYGARVRFKYF